MDSVTKREVKKTVVATVLIGVFSVSMLWVSDYINGLALAWMIHDSGSAIQESSPTAMQSVQNGK